MTAPSIAFVLTAVVAAGNITAWRILRRKPKPRPMRAPTAMTLGRWDEDRAQMRMPRRRPDGDL